MNIHILWDMCYNKNVVEGRNLEERKEQKMKIYEVVSKFYDDLKVESEMQEIEAECCPDNFSEEREKFDEYHDFFTDKEEAEAFIHELLEPTDLTNCI